MNAAETEALEAPSHRPGNRLAKTGLTDTGRPDQAENRSFGGGIQFQHSQVLDDPFLYLFDPIVILFQHLAHIGEIHVLFRSLGPRQFEDEFQIGPQYLMVG